MTNWDRRRRSRALVRDISPNFCSALANYFGTGPTDVAASRAAHDQYVEALQAHGVEITRLPSLAEHPDCCFVEDAAVVVDGAVVLCNLGHPARRGEQVSIRDALNGSLEVIEMPEGAYLDGGDVMFLDDMFLVGRSSRSNSAGVDFLQQVIRERGFNSECVEVPESTLHLSTICSSPAPDVIVTAQGHLQAEQFNGLGADIVWIPNEESYGANTIGFEGNRVMISADYPVTKSLLEDLGFSITEVDMEHIRAADGSLTCLRIFYE